MKEYDIIAVGTGSALSVAGALLESSPGLRAAVIDRDEPGGICLTRGCIPSKLLLYPADMVRLVESAEQFGIEAHIKKVDFLKVMERMRAIIRNDIKSIREGLAQAKNMEFYNAEAEFTAPYTLRVGGETISAKKIILSPGSRPAVPAVEGLEHAGYLTSDTVLALEKLPESIAIIGGGYIAAEYGHFFSAMGSHVTIIGRNPRFLPQEEPEISALSARLASKYMTIITNHDVARAEKTLTGKKKITARNRATGTDFKIAVDEILVASGRASNSDSLHPERAGIATGAGGWITVNDYFLTSQPNVWALGDATGGYMFKHVANYQANILYQNLAHNQTLKADYHAVPHAVFGEPEIASVGMKEAEALSKYGPDKILIGLKLYSETAKGQAMYVTDCFAKVIVESENMKILGAHIVGPQASVLIQEIVNLMYTREQSIAPILDGMHIHPALSEVVERACRSLMPPEHYHHIISHNGL